MRRKKLSPNCLPFIVCFLIALFVSIANGAQKSKKPEAISAGETLPEFRLCRPDSAGVQKYLGLKTPNSFSLSQIPAKIILLEVFLLYCPVCQKQVPITNKLYTLFQQDPDLRNDVKVVGIAVQADPSKIGPYKEYLAPIFPIFPDPNLDIHKKLGEPKVPFFVVTTNSGKVLSTHLGLIENIDELLCQIRKFHKQL